ncbi:MAG: HpcH/HpaI aldolase/citrate lyase family protein [Solirubrobacteraceae bacterium]
MRSRRSCLSVPGSSERMLAKASGLAADEIVIDLEDAVAATAKDEARALVVDSLAAGALDGRTVAVRVNGLDTPWCHRDVVALADGPAAAAVTTLIIPKVQSPEDIDWVERLLDMIGAGALGIHLQALIETADGLRRAGDVARSGARLEALIIGYADLRASLGRPANPDEPADRWSFAQETVLVAAKAAGLQAIDGPHLRVDDPAGLQAWAAHTRAMGYDGKWAIHPSQLETLNVTFAPTPEEVERAYRIVAALESAEADAGRGAVALAGEMIDEALRKQAYEVMARAHAAGLSGPALQPREAGA